MDHVIGPADADADGDAGARAGSAADRAPGLAVRLRQAGPIPLDLAFDCAPGEVLALFGHSGAGKTTVLRAVAGLYRPAAARVRCDGEDWADTARGLHVPTERRRVGYVFQDYALFPHLRVHEQLAVAMGHRPRATRAARVAELLAQVRLEGLADRRPAQLSGGQQQRVALARALARDPAVLLLDEPFAAVDRPLRLALQRELATLCAGLRLPVVLVTHDFDDVVRLASRLVILDRGRVLAAGGVTELTARDALPGVREWREPAVALEARLESWDEGRGLARLRAGALELLVPGRPAAVGARVRAIVSAREVILADRRPEGLSLHNVVETRVVALEPGATSGLELVRLDAGGTPLLALVTGDAVRRLALAPGAPVLALVKAVSIETIGAPAPDEPE